MSSEVLSESREPFSDENHTGSCFTVGAHVWVDFKMDVSIHQKLGSCYRANHPSQRQDLLIIIAL